MNIFTWNCRGAGSKRFLRVFKEYRRRYRTSIAIIVEPRISGVRAVQVVEGLGFDKYLIVDAVGFSGGIWLVWDSTIATITEVDRSAQMLLVQVTMKDASWYLSAVYANPALVQRRALWQSIREIAHTMEDPWLLMGDFNSILQPSDKSGGAPFDASRAKEFQDCVLDAGLVDLGFAGPPFTWFKQGVKERLDRGLGNAKWIDRFPEVTVRHLP
ncbi:unnamed protein product [Linum trigynum]|uniref:Endonuclease/exonuclease/phosphatase domain-containing protein n=1 Tax=Linum trigynum TaxID=586398 RepID=A0AAV2E397_9ROSI